MGVVDPFLLLVALLALLLPCALTVILCADRVVVRIRRAAARRRAVRCQRRLLVSLDRTLDAAIEAQRDAVETVACDGRPTIGQLAADLRRLGQLRNGVATKSYVWHAATLRAYDDRLRLACRYLGVSEHLGELGGVDLQIERVRVEGALIAGGLVLGDDAQWGRAA
jgi:hypothetical protein